MLYIVGTPIGNLGDWSDRAREIVAKCEYVLCEDTRHTGGLLRHFGIEKRLMSFHMFNERSREEGVLEDLQGGVDVALVSDAGMPVVCDPGAKLVRAARDLGVTVNVVPGPCAFVAAMALCGCEAPIGFFGYPEKKSFVKQVERCEGTAIYYVAPHDVKKVLSWCKEGWKVQVARELTKKFEEVTDGMPDPVRGEMVLLVQGQGAQSSLAIDESTLVTRLETLGVKPREAIRLVAELSGMSQKAIYELAKKG